MATKIEICNMALSHLGTGKVIQSLTERSEEARSINTFYDVAYVATIRDFSIPSTKKFLTLQLVEENPTSEWRYSYRYPNECVLIKRILSGTRNDSRQTRVPFPGARRSAPARQRQWLAPGAARRRVEAVLQGHLPGRRDTGGDPPALARRDVEQERAGAHCW